jgi:hypothetical protein
VNDPLLLAVQSIVQTALGRHPEERLSRRRISFLPGPPATERSTQKKKRPEKLGAPPKPKNQNRGYAFFFAFNAFKAKVKRDLYRFAVFSDNVRFRIALSKSENVADASFSAAAASPDVNAARIFLTDERTCVRFMRFTAARRSVCRIFFNTDFVFFLCFTAVP